MPIDRKLRQEVKSRPCLICGQKPGDPDNPVDPCHVRTYGATRQDHPKNLIPMCRRHHNQQHGNGPRAGWAYLLKEHPRLKRDLEAMGWVIYPHPFQPNKMCMFHPEVK